MQNETITQSNYSTQNETEKDAELWNIAKRGAGFKMSLFMYLAVNSLLIAVWYFSSGRHSYFWPVWPLLGWGIGISIQYFNAYHGTTLFSAEEEYKKLKNNL